MHSDWLMQMEYISYFNRPILSAKYVKRKSIWQITRAEQQNRKKQNQVTSTKKKLKFTTKTILVMIHLM